MNARRATPLLAVAMVLAAATFGVPALYVPGFALLLAFGVAWIWVWLVALQARLDLEPGPRSVVEGQPYPLRVRVVGGGVLPLPAGTAGHPLAQRSVAIEGSRAELEIMSPRRGWRRIEGATLVITDPLGLASARVRATSSAAVLVLPRVEDLVAQTGAMNGREDSMPGVAESNGAGLGKRALDFEVDGLRAYRPGTPASRIHWPILARTGELVERRLVGGGDASPIIVMDAERPVDSDALDRAVRAAASLCCHLAPLRGCLLVLPGDRIPLRIDPELRAWPHAHARLAVVEASTAPADLRVAGVAGPVVWVSANGTTPHLPSGLVAGTPYLVTATSIDLGPPAFTVAGCDAHALPANRARAKARVA